ncbi:hypothetical protein KY290_021091 [Solanum tuberosum]|uniref:Uncharacterized protein n=1 Tax=Solanum tuberosum TaxID=4113 RepID=A0ABQ7V2K5_SOLTU|nr:hypothetical protein KY289_022385 [Solanum tuberosum]KAH0695072.1 hypothetical protein KY285_022169 [Solanum tuberosum]KAH0757598.1 hypothetical protein KY290_021091 [Solanum tuberosum]
MERVSELGQWQKREVKTHGTSWDVKKMDAAIDGLGWFSLGLKGKADLALWTYDGTQITFREPLVLDRAATIERPGFWLSKAISEAIANSSKLEGQEAREKNTSEETMQLSQPPLFFQSKVVFLKMADAFVSFAVQKLVDFLIQQVSLRTNLRKEVEWLRNELLFIESFLKDAEQKQCGDQRVQQWVFEINSIANDAVAILETYSFEVVKGDDDGFPSCLKACACICKKEMKFYNVAEEIQSLKNRIMDISRKQETYGITNINNAREGPSNQVRTLRRTTSYVDDQDYIFVGYQDVVQTLLAELLKAEPRRRVVSIYGMGGLGKTTLARNLYISPRIIKSIQGHSKETLDLLERMTKGDLEIYLRDLLKERKYLVVVDDVWHKEAWESLKRAFPDSKNGSRVIITTRKEDVTERVDDRGFVHKLCFLSQEESWDLFCRKLLDVRAMIPKMESLAKDMVEKCRGLHLVIVVLSGLLSHKKGLDEWKKVKDHLWKNIIEDKYIEISNILSLSYSDLSTALKQCFLYFGIFPEDKVVDA